MATNASPFIVNIVPLQNIASDIRGTTELATAQAQIANLQTMIDTTNHIIYADAFSNFTPGKTIDVYANLNLSNAGLYSNSNAVTLNSDTNATTIRTILYGTSSTNIGASTFVQFYTPFISTPNVTATCTTYIPAFMTVDNISISSFNAYSWSVSDKRASTPFQWQAVL